MPLVNGPLDWSSIRLVVFDVDGTLYNQRGMRLSMLVSLLGNVVQTRSLQVLDVLRTFRHVREELAEELSTDFSRLQYELTAKRCNCSVARVKEIVEEWIERKPLSRLLGCRFSGLEEVFRGASAQNKIIGILSDYPARDKMQALQLDADIIVSAGDGDVGVLKPHPGGLKTLIERANVTPETAIMVGDRVERDWAIADKLGVRALIRSKRNIAGVDTFTSYRDGPFQDLLRGVPV
jgi:phosphoglycolate phosphatase/putative hydrolase of the HAD superfamily